MGKKRRKKSRRRKKRLAEERSEERASDGAAGDVADGSSEGPTSDVPAEDEAQSELDAVIDVDDDLDSPEARAELIATVAELQDAAAESSEAAEAEDAEAQSGPPEETGEETESEVAVSESGLESGLESGSDPASDEEPGAPLIGPDALVALSEFRQEGVATVPEELIVDLGDSSSPEERDRLLAAALAHVEMQDAMYRVPLDSRMSRRWKGVLATTLFIMALLLAGLPPDFLVPDGPRPMSTGEEVRGIRRALLLQVEQIEAFRAQTERLPISLSEVETALPDIRFVRSSNRLYQLIAYTASGEAIVYDSSAPGPSFGEIATSWPRTESDS